MARRHSIRVRLCAALVVVFAALSTPATASEESLLQRARDRVADVARQVEAARGEAGEAAEQLEAATEQLERLEQAVNDAAAAVDRQAETVSRASSELRRLRVEAEERRELVRRRAVDLYKGGSGGTIEMMFAAADADTAVRGSAVVQRLQAADLAAIEDVGNAQIAIEAQQRHFESENTRLLKMQADLEVLLEEATALRESRALRLASAQQQVSDLETRKDNLAEDADELAALIERNRATVGAAAVPSTAGYVWPRCDRVTSGFGRRWGRLHAGLDIDGNTGDPIGASKGGVVIFAGRQSGYGNLTLIDHGDGVVTAYAHQSTFLVSEGQRVERGELIGQVGNTGRSTGPHLHFETRVHGGAVDPRRFMPDGC